MAKKYSGDLITKLAQALIQGQGNPMEQAASRYGIDPLYNDAGTKTVGYDWGDTAPTDAQIEGIEALQDKIAKTQDISKGVSLPQLGSLTLGAAKAHPFKAMALGGSAMGNLGGLTDNNKFGGQLAGLGLGGLGSYMLGDALGPYGKIMMTMGGGNLGALFDKLRARREKEQPQQGYYGGR